MDLQGSWWQRLYDEHNWEEAARSAWGGLENAFRFDSCAKLELPNDITERAKPRKIPPLFVAYEKKTSF